MLKGNNFLGSSNNMKCFRPVSEVHWSTTMNVLDQLVKMNGL